MDSAGLIAIARQSHGLCDGLFHSAQTIADLDRYLEEVNDLKILAKAQGGAVSAGRSLATGLAGFFFRDPASSLIDQKCNEQTQGVLSANALKVLASSSVNTSALEPFWPRQGQSPTWMAGSIFCSCWRALMADSMPSSPSDFPL